MADDAKRTECVKVCFEERLFIDINRLAILEDRKLADYLYLLARRHVYGHGSRKGMGEEGTASD